MNTGHMHLCMPYISRIGSHMQAQDKHLTSGLLAKNPPANSYRFLDDTNSEKVEIATHAAVFDEANITMSQLPAAVVTLQKVGYCNESEMTVLLINLQLNGHTLLYFQLLSSYGQSCPSEWPLLATTYTAPP